MPVVSTLGAMSSRGFGEFNQQTAANYIEDVFSTYLYTGNSGTQTVDNGIDLSGKGGLVWVKGRNRGSNHALLDSSRGNNYLVSNLTDAQTNLSDFSTTFTQLSNGFRFVGDGGGLVNENTYTYASWTFRKQPKFFDVITYTGNGANRTISHNLGSVPGMIIIKRTDTTAAWAVYHSALANTEYLVLNTTAAKATGATYWNSTTPTSTVFSLGTATDVNANGGTYVAYLYASNAGGFGADGSQNVISCGGYTGNGGTQAITLGYEPQYILIKKASGSPNEGWWIYDTMRGMSLTDDAYLLANTSAAEGTVGSSILSPTATGFNITSSASAINQSSSTYIYMAIRRGPMRTPTSGTSVFAMDGLHSATAPNPWFVSGFPVDWGWLKRPAAVDDWISGTRMIGVPSMAFNTNGAEASIYTNQKFDYMNGYFDANSSTGYYARMFRRAPGFMDVVCYSGTSVARTINHNLGVIPELIIVKSRSNAYNWQVYSATTSNTDFLLFNSNDATTTSSARWNNTSPTSSVFTVGTGAAVNGSGSTFVAYLFASCPGVSKVGSYTGTGSTQTISCGFTGGARFLLIKRTDSVGDWWIWDTTRGMVAGTDPRLAANTANAEINNNWVYTTTGGFQIVTSDATVNANGGTYLFFAVA